MAHLCEEAHARFLGRRPGFQSSSSQTGSCSVIGSAPRVSQETGLAAQRHTHLLAVVSHIGAEESVPASQEIHVVTMTGRSTDDDDDDETNRTSQQHEAGLRQCKHTRCKKITRLSLSANCQDTCSTWESLHPTMRVGLRERRKTVHLHKLMQKLSNVNAVNETKKQLSASTARGGKIRRWIETFDRHLSLTVQAQPPQITVLAHVGQFLPQTSCHRVSEKRGVLSLLTRVPET